MSNTKVFCESCIDNKFSIFRLLKPDEKEFLAMHHSCLSYKKGELIYKSGDKPSGLLCLSEGKVKIMKEGVGGREQIIRMSKPVGFIGYRALFANELYIFCAMAIEDSRICIIEKDALFEVVKHNGDLALAMLQEMAKELGFSNQRTVNLTQKHVRGRLAESIVFLIQTFGYEEDHQTIRVYLSREDIAHLSSMTTSNAIRTLSIFASEGLIQLEGRKIKILNYAIIKKISEQG